MQFDWKDLALWCFCAFFLGMCVAPVFFLDADFLGWGSICGAALGVTLAVGSYLVNSSSHRLQAGIADQTEFQRNWQLFGRGELVREDIKIAVQEAQMLIDRYKNGEQLKRGHFILLNHPGANVNVEDDPFVHRAVDIMWRAYATYKDLGLNANERDIPINQYDMGTLESRIVQMQQVRELVKSNYLDVLLPYFIKRGWKIETGENGEYRVINQGR